jgi:SseB protein N-terminal domain
MSAERPADEAPRLDQLIDAELLVPLRSSIGATPDPTRVGLDAMRHGTDENHERFVAAFTSIDTFSSHGPPGSDWVRLPARLLFERADTAQERVVIDPGAPSEVDLSPGILSFLAAGIDPNQPEVMRARRPLGAMPPLEAPEQVPEPFGSALRSTLSELPQVERAWLLRAGTAWTAGIQMVPDAVLSDFDTVRNRLHALATEHLGSRRLLAVTDLRAPALRDEYDAAGAPYYVAERGAGKGFLSRIFGG